MPRIETWACKAAKALRLWATNLDKAIDGWCQDRRFRRTWAQAVNELRSCTTPLTRHTRYSNPDDLEPDLEHWGPGLAGEPGQTFEALVSGRLVDLDADPRGA